MENEEEAKVYLTEFAAQKIKEIRAAENVTQSSLRMKVIGGGCSGFAYDLGFDDPAECDLTFDCYGIKVIIDQMSFQYLIGTTVDYVEGLQGAGFKFNNPSVSSVCGCGSSFSV